MEDFEKQKLLKTLKFKDADTLWVYLKSGDISLDEMKQARILLHEAKTELERRLKNLKDEQEAEAKRETDLWNDCKSKNTEKAYNDYLEEYPDGKYKSQAKESLIQVERRKKEQQIQVETNFWNECNIKGTKSDYIRYLTGYPNGAYKPQAEACLSEIFRREAEEKRRLLSEMKESPENFDCYTLKKILYRGIINESDLIAEDIITKEALELHLNPPLEKFIDQDTWGDLPTIPKGKTDIYFFGIPSSGKSCVLAGTLYSANKKGILRPDISVAHGYRYMDELTNCVKIGYVPKPTAHECVNCLSFSLSSNEEHPLNVIEMSGEIFVNTYYDLVGEKKG
ncbi:MAG: hypothetical protein LBH60_09110, partial [Prevotellaceae bacterium]|nr:hypothetical protein [Prevotellaceae bacterium]